MQPLAGIEAVERLVEEQDAGLVDERRGELGALAHALGVGAHRAVGGVGQLDRGHRPVGRGARVGHALQLGVELGELEAGEVRAGRPRAPARGRSRGRPIGSPIAGRPAIRTDPGGRRQQPGQQVQERGLAGAVGPEQAGHAGAEGERDVVDGDDVAVPARDVVERDGRDGRGRVGGRRRRRWRRRGGGGVGSSSLIRRSADSGAARSPATRRSRRSWPRRTPSPAGSPRARPGCPANVPKTAALSPSIRSAGLSRIRMRDDVAEGPVRDDRDDDRRDDEDRDDRGRRVGASRRPGRDDRGHAAQERCGQDGDDEIARDVRELIARTRSTGSAAARMPPSGEHDLWRERHHEDRPGTGRRSARARSRCASGLARRTAAARRSAGRARTAPGACAAQNSMTRVAVRPWYVSWRIGDASASSPPAPACDGQGRDADRQERGQRSSRTSSVNGAILARPPRPMP